MRQKLAERLGRRGRWTATFSCMRTRTSHGHPIQMLCFHNVCDETGQEVTDHVHFSQAQCWKALNLQPGERVTFEASVATYMKGYADERHRDYRLSHPRKIRRIDPPKNGEPQTPSAQLRLF